MTIPQRIGRYQIVRQIGNSMTDVYLAIDTVENRKTALKLIKRGADAVTQLMVEAERRGAAIQEGLRELDPRVVQIYEYGEEDGYFFVAMQYVEGRSLADVLRADGVVDAMRAAAIALEICEQLAKFHACQSAVVHGDIKPSNIHLGYNETVRLLDFGIAKTLRANGSATIHQFGSPGYCSPERLNRSEVDEQSDLWAVGATLYEMLAGVPPYQAEDTRKLERLIRSKRPPRALPVSCPEGLRAIVTKALAPNPSGRYRSAGELQADLQAFLEGRPPVAQTDRRPGWSANATLEAARAVLQKATRTIRRGGRVRRIVGAAACFAAGMGLWIGGALGYDAWHTSHLALPVPPPSLPNEMLLFRAAGERIIESYRRSAELSLRATDWSKAEVLLERAVEMGGTDDRLLGQLALARGYATLLRLIDGMYAEPAARVLRVYARDQFQFAAGKLPKDADPHLALARVYAHWLPDLDKAMAELDEAERLGATLGMREFAQVREAYRVRTRRVAQASRLGRDRRRAWR
jgi:hypothetical protein